MYKASVCVDNARRSDLLIRPSNNDWSALMDWPDEALNKGIKDTIGQLRFEKFYDGANKLIHYSIKAFIGNVLDIGRSYPQPYLTVFMGLLYCPIQR